MAPEPAGEETGGGVAAGMRGNRCRTLREGSRRRLILGAAAAVAAVVTACTDPRDYPVFVLSDPTLLERAHHIGPTSFLPTYNVQVRFDSLEALCELEDCAERIERLVARALVSDLGFYGRGSVELLREVVAQYLSEDDLARKLADHIRTAGGTCEQGRFLHCTFVRQLCGLGYGPYSPEPVRWTYRYEVALDPQNPDEPIRSFAISGPDARDIDTAAYLECVRGAAAAGRSGQTGGRDRA